MLQEIRREELRKKRLDAGLSQQDAAYKCRISAAQYQRIEAGYINPNQETADKIIHLFQLPNNYFNKAESL